MLKQRALFFCSLILLILISTCMADTESYYNLSSVVGQTDSYKEHAESTWFPTDTPEPIDTDIPTSEPTRLGDDFGWVSIESVPSGADAYFDGISQGVTPARVKVKSTASPYHQIWMQKSGYQEWSTSISENPVSGQTVTIRASLVSLPPTDTPTEKPTPTLPPTLVPIPTPYPTEIPTIHPTPTRIGGDKGWISVDSIPGSGEVTFDGVYQGSAPVLIPVYSTGSPYHQILVRMDGYHDWTRSLSENPESGETITVLASLIPIAQLGSIRVTSNPVKSIAILDGGIQDLTPCTFNYLSPGLHTVSIIHDGYQPYSEQTRVTAGGQSQINAGLSPIVKAGAVYITSNPSGADIYLDRSYKGQTPFLVSASSGTHRMELKLAGYNTYQSDINFITTQQTQYYATLSPESSSFGSIQVSSSPGGSSVRLNNDYYGVTPDNGYLDIPSLPQGIYNILITHPQNQDYSGTVAVTQGKITTVSVALQASPHSTSVNGTLSVISNPSGAYIFLNNQIKGITPLVIPSIIPGIYTLTLKTDGYQDIMRQVNISAGLETDATIDMTPVQPTPTATPVPTITIEPTPTESPGPVIPVITSLLLIFICKYSGRLRR
jgi:hypothetical protein